MDRRDFMRRGAALAAILATGSLTACGDDAADDAAAAEGDTADPTPTSAPAQATTEPAEAEPEPGGSIRVALLASPTETLNPATAASPLEFTLLFAVHDSLVLLEEGAFVFQLAESIEPNNDGSEWTIVLREGATFHNGSPVTSADVVYSIGLYGASPTYAQFFSLIDLAAMTAPDDRTVVLPMVAPRSDLIESALGQLSVVVPDGFTDWGANIGSGPFVLESFEAGVGAVIVANPDYWGGAPSLERVEFISIADAATKVNALTSGEVEYVNGIDAAAVATLDGVDGVRLVLAGETSSGIRCFAFNRRQAPFDDPRVVEACKVAVDRQQLIDVVSFGNAVLGNDMPSLGFAGYPTGLPQRERDVEAATRLFAEAGVTEFTIRAADWAPGLVSSAELFAQQLAECGVTATVDVGDPATYFSDFAQVLSTPCQSFFFRNRPAITLLTGHTGSMASFNVFGSGDPDYDAALTAAITTIDRTERDTQIAALLEAVHEQEGWLIWSFEQQIDAAVEGLEGVDLDQAVPGFATATLG